MCVYADTPMAPKRHRMGRVSAARQPLVRAVDAELNGAATARKTHRSQFIRSIECAWDLSQSINRHPNPHPHRPAQAIDGPYNSRRRLATHASLQAHRQHYHPRALASSTTTSMAPRAPAAATTTTAFTLVTTALLAACCYCYYRYWGAGAAGGQKPRRLSKAEKRALKYEKAKLVRAYVGKRQGQGGRLAGWLAGWLIGWLVGRLVDVGPDWID